MGMLGGATGRVRQIAASMASRVGGGYGAKWRLRQIAASTASRVGGGLYFALDYPTSADNSPRYGYGKVPHAKLQERIERDRGTFAATLRGFAKYQADLSRISAESSDPREPSFVNGFLPGLDAAALYCFIREYKPAHYLEIGSGNSTKFVARARHDAGLSMKLTSIDPHPRADIDGLCDRVIRAALEAVDLSVFSELRAGDVVFFDGSHRVFMNSDVVAFFLDVLPSIAPGVLVGIHDVYLPDDYPADIAGKFYSEQYLLAAHLLAGAALEIQLPAHYVSTDDDLKGALDIVWNRPGFERVERQGDAFWFTPA